jgi:peptidoglycan/LPS O-acetylase OafA/YrhL
MSHPQSIPKLEGRLPSLDGWRAISIALVLFAHSTVPLTWHDIAHYCGSLGVRFFFVISGFLITWLLLREGHRRNNVSLINFYARRVIRIFPVYYIYLCACWILDSAGILNAGPPSQQWFNIFFLANYGPCEGVTGVLWSLGVEEQFYLIWPVVFTGFQFFVRKKAPLAALAAIIALAPLMRVLSLLSGQNESTHLLLHRFSFIFHMDILAWGCAGAVISWNWPDVTRFIVRHVTSVFVFSTILIALPYVSRGIDGLGIETVFGPSLQACGFILLVFASTAKPEYLPFRPLNTDPLVWLGMISYSLYLWHSLFCSASTSKILSNLGIPQSLWVIISVTIAAASYHLLESPLLRLRRAYRS